MSLGLNLDAGVWNPYPTRTTTLLPSEVLWNLARWMYLKFMPYFSIVLMEAGDFRHAGLVFKDTYSPHREREAPVLHGEGLL